MNSAPEDFDGLKKLLALKRCEQPPPAFFDHFSDKVIARIEAARQAPRLSLWQRLFPELDARPVLACAYGLIITGLLVVGLGISESLESEDRGEATLGSPWFAAQTPAPAAVPASVSPAMRHSLADQNGGASSVLPVFSSSAARNPFDVRPVTVSYTLP